jgi:hypothetical protein
MPKQDLGNRLQTYWIEGRGEESISPFFFFWGEARRQDGGERGGRSINTTKKRSLMLYRVSWDGAERDTLPLSLCCGLLFIGQDGTVACAGWIRRISLPTRTVAVNKEHKGRKRTYHIKTKTIGSRYFLYLAIKEYKKMVKNSCEIN